MNPDRWLMLAAVLVVPLMHTYQHGVRRWIRWSGRIADRLMPSGEREFANFRSIAAEAERAVAADDLGGMVALARCSTAVALALWSRARHCVRTPGATLLSVIVSPATVQRWALVRGATGASQRRQRALHSALSSDFGSPPSAPRGVVHSVLLTSVVFAQCLPVALVRTLTGVRSEMERSLVAGDPSAHRLGAHSHARVLENFRSLGGLAAIPRRRSPP